MSVEKIIETLKELQSQNKQITACMVAKKGLEGVIMFPDSFKTDAGQVWEPLSNVLNDMLYVVDKYNQYKLDKILVDVLGYSVAFYILDSTDTALMVFIKQQEGDTKNFSSLHDEIEKARNKILQM